MEKRKNKQPNEEVSSEKIVDGVSDEREKDSSGDSPAAQLEDAKKLLKILSADKIAEVLEMPIEIVQGLQITDKSAD